MKLIDYDKLRKHLTEQAQIASDYNINNWRIICRTLLDVIDFIDGMGFIDPEKNGKWIYDDFDGDKWDFQCCLCRGYSMYGSKYCPNCGAKMEGVDGQ